MVPTLALIIRPLKFQRYCGDKLTSSKDKFTAHNRTRTAFNKCFAYVCHVVAVRGDEIRNAKCENSYI